MEWDTSLCASSEFSSLRTDARLAVAFREQRTKSYWLWFAFMFARNGFILPEIAIVLVVKHECGQSPVQPSIGRWPFSVDGQQLLPRVVLQFAR